MLRNWSDFIHKNMAFETMCIVAPAIFLNSVPNFHPTRWDVCEAFIKIAAQVHFRYVNVNIMCTFGTVRPD